MSTSTPTSSSKRSALKANAKLKQVAELHVRIEQQDAFEFRARFDNPHWPELLVDEPPPLGKEAAPNASRLLGVAIGNCLGASLLFCLGRAAVDVRAIDADVFVEVVRDPRHRLRIPKVRVVLWPSIAEATDAFARVVAEFQDYCVVTESVRRGIDVVVEVSPLIDGLEGPSS